MYTKPLFTELRVYLRFSNKDPLTSLNSDLIN